MLNPKVLNVRDVGYNYPNSVYVGRPTDYGNPFSVEKFGRALAIEKYKKLILKDKSFVEQIKKDLKGKNLLCWCAPLPCHAEILLAIANREE